MSPHDSTMQDRLLTLRSFMDMNQKEFSSFVGVSYRGYQSIEQGAIKNPGIDAMAKISQRTGVSLDFLYFGKETALEKSGLIVDVVTLLPQLNENQLRTVFTVATTALETFTGP